MCSPPIVFLTVKNGAMALHMRIVHTYIPDTPPGCVRPANMDSPPRSSGTVWKTTWYNRKRSRPHDTRFFSTSDVAPSFLVNGRPTLKTSKRGTDYIIFYDRANHKWSAASSHLGASHAVVPAEHQEYPDIAEATDQETADFYGDSDTDAETDEETDRTHRRPPVRRVMTRSRADRSNIEQINIIGGLMGRRLSRRSAVPNRYIP